MKHLLLLSLLFCSLPAMADTLQLEPGACDMLVKHVPSPDVDYQPGTDIYGRPVAAAGVPAPDIPLGPIEIPLTVSLADRLHLSVSGTTGTTTTTTTGSGIGPGGAINKYGDQAYVGTVVVDGDRVLLNGAPLTDETEANLAVLCMKANKP